MYTQPSLEQHAARPDAIGNDASALAICLELTTAIGRTRRLEDTYELALDALVNGLGVERAAILLIDPDGITRFKAWRGLSPAYRRALEGRASWAPSGLEFQSSTVPDVTADRRLAAFQDAFLREGIGALVCVPLTNNGRAIGRFMLYYREAMTPAPRHLALAELIAAQFAFAVERTRSGLAAAENEQRLRFALEAARMGTWVWDIQMQQIRWSDRLEAIHGLPPGTFDGSFASYEREIHPDDRGHVLASLQRAVAEGTPHEVEYRIVAPDGRVRWVEGKGQVQRADDGTPVRMTGICMDVTARKEAETERMAALAESHRLAQRLAAIVRSTDDAIFGKDLQGIVTSWNTGAERLFGFTAAEMTGKPADEIVPPDRRHEEQEVLNRITEGQSVAIETVRQRKDGTRVDIALTVSPVRDEHGTILGSSRIARDITSRKKGETELADLHRRLTTLIEASTSLLDTPDTTAVTSATVAIARELLVADGYALWRRNPAGPNWQTVKSEGVSPAFAARVIGADEHAGDLAAVDPVVVTDAPSMPLPAEQIDAIRQEGIRSMLVCPMRFGTLGYGRLAFYYRTSHAFTEVETRTAQALANLASAAMTTAELYGQQTSQREAAETAGRQAKFLAEAAAVLSQSLNYEETLAAIANLAVPTIADWCAVDMVGLDGRIDRLAVAHPDPAKVHLARQLHDRHSRESESPNTIRQVIRSQMPAMASISPAALAAALRNDEHRQIIVDLGLKSYLCVPLVSSGRALGAITFVYAESGRHYTESDLRFAQEVASRAALAIENARAYREAYEANRLKDEFLATLSHELRTPLNAILGYAQMLGMGVLEADRQSRAIEVLTRNAEALRQMIDDVLDVSRITAGKIRLNVQPVDLVMTLGAAVATIQPAADAKGVVLQVTADQSVPRVSGDAGSPAANRLEPALERGEVHTARRPHPAARRAGQRTRPDGRQRHRTGRRRGIPSAHLRALPAGRQPLLARARRPWPRPFDRPRARRAARRRGLGHQRRSRQGRDVLGKVAGAGRPFAERGRRRQRRRPA